MTLFMPLLSLVAFQNFFYSVLEGFFTRKRAALLLHPNELLFTIILIFFSISRKRFSKMVKSFKSNILRFNRSITNS